MKTLLLSLLAIAAFTVCAQTSAADDPLLPQLSQLRFDLFIARLPEARALELLPSLRDEAQCGAMQKKIIEMIAKKEADLVDCQTIITKSGQRSIAENIRAIRYPAEYSTMTDPTKEPTKVPDPATYIPPAFPSNPRTPTAFESKDVGITLELEPTLREDGQHVDLQLDAKHSTLLGWSKITVDVDAGKRGGKQHVTVEQPELQTLQVRTNIVATAGGSVLLGVHKLQTATQQVEVFILTTTVLKSGDATGKNAAQEPEKRRRRRNQ